MAKLLLNLHNVEADEADDVRAFLGEHGIEYYETRPSRWGISHGGIWLRNDRDQAQAKGLMADYQAKRRERVRAEHAAAKAAGTAPTFRDVLRQEPLRVLLTVLAIIFMLGLLALVPLLLLRHPG